jgi:hypothetical protein
VFAGMARIAILSIGGSFNAPASMPRRLGEQESIPPSQAANILSLHQDHCPDQRMGLAFQEAGPPPALTIT